MLCKKTANSICGFDDNYGYGKFDDICHMLNVNCFYKYSKYLEMEKKINFKHLSNFQAR